MNRKKTILSNFQFESVLRIISLEIKYNFPFTYIFSNDCQTYASINVMNSMHSLSYASFKTIYIYIENIIFKSQKKMLYYH